MHIQENDVHIVVVRSLNCVRLRVQSPVNSEPKVALGSTYVIGKKCVKEAGRHSEWAHEVLCAKSRGHER